MDNVEQLQFRLELKKLKCMSDFEQAFSSDEFATRFAEFTQGKIGSRWLQSDASKLFHEWQRSY